MPYEIEKARASQKCAKASAPRAQLFFEEEQDQKCVKMYPFHFTVEKNKSQRN